MSKSIHKTHQNQIIPQPTLAEPPNHEINPDPRNHKQGRSTTTHEINSSYGEMRKINSQRKINSRTTITAYAVDKPILKPNPKPILKLNPKPSMPFRPRNDVVLVCISSRIFEMRRWSLRHLSPESFDSRCCSTDIIL